MLNLHLAETYIVNKDENQDNWFRKKILWI